MLSKSDSRLYPSTFSNPLLIDTALLYTWVQWLKGLGFTVSVQMQQTILIYISELNVPKQKREAGGK